MQGIRSFFILAVLTASLGLKGQNVSIVPVDTVTKLITYKEVVPEKGTKDSLYIRAIAWINTYFPNPSDVTRVRDRDNGVIKGVHRFKLTYTDKDGAKREAPLCEYSFTIECRDGRYRFILTEFTRKEASRQPMEKFLDKKDPSYNPMYDDYLRQLDAFAKDWTASIKKGMKPPVIIKDEW